MDAESGGDSDFEDDSRNGTKNRRSCAADAVGADQDMTKIERIRAKNRRAQAAYRDRRKKEADGMVEKKAAIEEQRKQYQGKLQQLQVYQNQLQARIESASDQLASFSSQVEARQTSARASADVHMDCTSEEPDNGAFVALSLDTLRPGKSLYDRLQAHLHEAASAHLPVQLKLEGLPGRPRLVGFTDSPDTWQDHAFCHTHMTVSMRCCLLRLRDAHARLRTLQSEDGNTQAPTWSSRTMWGSLSDVCSRHQLHSSVAQHSIVSGAATETARGAASKRSCSAELMAAGSPLPCMVHSLAIVVKQHVHHMSQPALGQLAHELRLLAARVNGGFQPADSRFQPVSMRDHQVDLLDAVKAVDEQRAGQRGCAFCSPVHTMCLAEVQHEISLMSSLLRHQATEAFLLSIAARCINPKLANQLQMHLTWPGDLPFTEVEQVNVRTFEALSLSEGQRSELETIWDAWRMQRKQKCASQKAMLDKLDELDSSSVHHPLGLLSTPLVPVLLPDGAQPGAHVEQGGRKAAGMPPMQGRTLMPPSIRATEATYAQLPPTCVVPTSRIDQGDLQQLKQLIADEDGAGLTHCGIRNTPWLCDAPKQRKRASDCLSDVTVEQRLALASVSSVSPTGGDLPMYGPPSIPSPFPQPAHFRPSPFRSAERSAIPASGLPAPFPGPTNSLAVHDQQLLDSICGHHLAGKAEPPLAARAMHARHSADGSLLPGISDGVLSGLLQAPAELQSAHGVKLEWDVACGGEGVAAPWPKRRQISCPGNHFGSMLGVVPTKRRSTSAVRGLEERLPHLSMHSLLDVSSTGSGQVCREEGSPATLHSASWLYTRTEVVKEVRRLQQELRETDAQFHAYFFQSVVTPVQYAIYRTEAMPFLPDLARLAQLSRAMGRHQALV